MWHDVLCALEREEEHEFRQITNQRVDVSFVRVVAVMSLAQISPLFIYISSAVMLAWHAAVRHNTIFSSNQNVTNFPKIWYKLGLLGNVIWVTSHMVNAEQANLVGGLALFWLIIINLEYYNMTRPSLMLVNLFLPTLYRCESGQCLPSGFKWKKLQISDGERKGSA